MAIKDEIRQRRQQLKLSQSELAKAANVTQAMVSKLESGKDVRLSTLQAIVTALDLKLLLLDQETVFQLKRLKEFSSPAQNWLDQYGVSDDD